MFIPHQGCPHQCVFCDQTAITGCDPAVIDAAHVRGAVESFIRHSRPAGRTTHIAFYGGNFLGLPGAMAGELLAAASEYVRRGVADSLRVSTRPDTVTTDALDRIREFPVGVVEIGVQSMDDGVLQKAGRGHTSEDAVKALLLLKKTGYRIGVQMMAGLPGDDERKALASAAAIAALAPDFVRIYPTLVLEGSVLAVRYREGSYVPMELDVCVDLVKRMYLIFEQRRIPVVRMGLLYPETAGVSSVVAGPRHPAFGHMVMSAVFLDRAAALLRRDGRSCERWTLFVHPRNISRMQGLRKRNLEELKRMFALRSVRVRPDASLGMDRIRAEPEATSKEDSGGCGSQPGSDDG